MRCGIIRSQISLRLDDAPGTQSCPSASHDKLAQQFPSHEYDVAIIEVWRKRITEHRIVRVAIYA